MNGNEMKEVIKFDSDIEDASKGVKKLSDKVEDLKQKASNIELAPTNEKVRKATKEALENKKKQNIEQKRAIEITRELNSLMKNASGSEEKRLVTVRAWRKEVAKLEAEYTKIAKSGGDTSKVSSELSDAYKNLNKALGESRITGFQKLINTFKRVGFYRIARRLFQLIEQGLAQGIQGLTEFDNTANKTLSSLSSSFDIIKSSIALSIMPLIEAVAPIVTDIAMSFANVAEQISKTSNAMKGVNTYTKINKKYMKDLQAEANKLSTSFDKFETLQGKESPFEEGIIPEDEMEKLKNSELAKTLDSLKSIISDIWDIIVNNIIPALKTLWDKLSPFLPAIAQFIAGMITMIAKIVDILDKAGLLKVSLIGILGIIVALKITTLIKNIKELAIGFSALSGVLLGLGTAFLIFEALKNAPFWISTLIALAGAISAVAFSIMAVKEGWKGVWGIGALVAGGITLGASIASLVNIDKQINAYANGGIAEKGSLFVANEKGPELVYSGPNNSSSIMNISQFKQAMVEAIYECADVFQQSDGSVVLNLDGAQIARSKSFKNELNRTNAGLNLR